MSNNLLTVWQSSCKEGFSAKVLPDGCRDVIFKVIGKERPTWFVSPLFNQSKNIYVEGGSKLIGYRMRPGVEFNEDKLICHLTCSDIVPDEVKNILDDFTRLDSSIGEALDCLASDISTVREATVRLGVSSRTLQRFILNKTGRTPSYWFQLARVRKAGKDLSSVSSLSILAEMHGFSDQAHMTREFQRWFSSTPKRVIQTPELISQLRDTGYG